MKSEEEKKLDSVMDRYFDTFGDNYPFFFTDMRSTEEIIEDIENCIKEGVKKEEPKISRDFDY